jgi:hypothetical protein
MRHRAILIFSLIATGVATVGGCVDKMLTVKTDPPGALVFLNGVEVGRSPVTRDFVWYGTYDVAVRKDGYETLKAHSPVIAPWWQWVPIDLLAELAPLRFRDEQTLTYTLRSEREAATDPQLLLNRAVEMEGRLQSSEKTRARQEPTSAAATTRPASVPVVQPTIRPAR